MRLIGERRELEDGSADLVSILPSFCHSIAAIDDMASDPLALPPAHDLNLTSRNSESETPENLDDGLDDWSRIGTGEH